MSRRLAREFAIQFLFSMDFNKEEHSEQYIEEFLQHKEEYRDKDEEGVLGKSPREYAIETLKGAMQHLEEIDKLIEFHTTGWKKERIAKVDLAILRLAIYEIVFNDNVPDSVAVNEAVELAKKYSTEDSGSFVNGVLGKIIRNKSEQDV
ncbi:MAG: transcription antitermination factor NusB [Lutisporaceae bacterium]